MSVKNHTVTGQRSMINFREFPVDPTFYSDELRPYVSQIIERHGLEEWKAVVLTNELHHHMGLWSVIGAKMGIRGREILTAPFDGIEIVSSAGSKPPYSCLNDGLQVSTGASLGRGAIRVIDSNEPSAELMYEGKKVTMSVKRGIVEEIERIISDYSGKYTFQSPRYFRELDKISVEYWLNWDRSNLFEEIIAAGISSFPKP